MSEQPLYKALAAAFVAEGVDTQFTLMGDGNMHWVTTLAGDHGVRTIHARHEHCACAMAMGYARATRDVGIVSVTQGPGFTQTATALTAAARGNVSLIVFAGDIPTTSRWYHQRFEQAPLSAATGAHHISVRTASRALECVTEAFYVARFEQRPVVLSVPQDLQKEKIAATANYRPSSELIPKLDPIEPDPEALEQLVALIEGSQKPIIIAGRGVMFSNAAEAVAELAARCGALLSTTLHTRGMFDHDGYSLGIAGGFSSELAREEFSTCDLVIAIGASLGHYTSDGGKLYPNASVVQIDANPHGLFHGLRVADLHVQADAALCVNALLAALRSRGTVRKGARTDALRQKIKAFRDDAEFDVEAGTIDPRSAISAIDDVLPKDWALVGSSGHSFYFTATRMRGRAPEDIFSLKDFGEIGSHLSYAIGVAVARGNGKVAVIDGDGSLMMHIQELETVRRHGLRLLIIALNDGAYGAELHKLRIEGHHPDHAIFGRPDFGGIAKAFGLRGATVTDTRQFADLFAGHAAADCAEMWDVHISQNVVSPSYRRRFGIAGLKKSAGKSARSDVAPVG